VTIAMELRGVMVLIWLLLILVSIGMTPVIFRLTQNAWLRGYWGILAAFILITATITVSRTASVHG